VRFVPASATARSAGGDDLASDVDQLREVAVACRCNRVNAPVVQTVALHEHGPWPARLASWIRQCPACIRQGELSPPHPGESAPARCRVVSAAGLTDAGREDVAVRVAVHQPSPDRTLAVQLDSTPDLTSVNSTQADCVDGEHQPTELALCFMEFRELAAGYRLSCSRIFRVSRSSM
jgi:hypothetical protein